MNYGLYLSASGVLTNAYRQDVFANNLANVETVAFKRDIPTIRQRDPAAVEAPSQGGDAGQKLLEKLGGGALAGPQRISFTPGGFRPGGALDMALEGENAFFAVSVKDPVTGGRSVQLTRDGRFTRDRNGNLTTINGDPVLDPNNQAIALPAGPVEIDTAGHIRQNGEAVGQVQVTGVADLNALRKRGNNLFAWDGKADARRLAANATVRPGFVEASGVDPVAAMLDMINATRDVASSANLVHYHDMMMDRAINTLGRVA